MTQTTCNPPNDGYTTNTYVIPKLHKVVITEPNKKQKAFFDEIGQHPKLVGNFGDNDYTVGDTVEDILKTLTRDFDFWFNNPICLMCICEDCCLERADMVLKRLEST